ncbi:MAG: NUDIX hydrolase [archaeon]|nr:NUDIX hydrolase [archaeon]
MAKKKFKMPSLTVDGIIKLENNKIALIQRVNDPFKNRYALPGGFVDYGETVENALVREMKEETSLDVKITKLFGVYSDPNRDPRGHTISIVYECEIKGEKTEKFKAADDAKNGKAVSIKEALKMKLAFDHGKILEDYSKIS